MKPLCLLALVVMICGCTPAIEYGRRSANEPQFGSIYQQPSVSVSSTASAAAQKNGEGDAGGGAPIPSIRLNVDHPEPEEVEALLKAFAGKPEAPAFNASRSVVKRSIVISVSKGEFRPADRFVNFRMRIKPENFEFTNYTGVETDDRKVDIEKFSLQKTSSAALDLGISKAITAGFAGKAEKVLTESGDVSARIEKLTTNIDDDTLDVYRESERGMDLSGTTVVNVSVTAQRQPDANSRQQTDIDWIVTDMKLTDKGLPLKSAKASMEMATLDYLKPFDLTADIVFDYVIRRVVAKAHEYSEHNQSIVYEVGHCKQKRAVIVKARELDIPRWQVAISDGGQAREVIMVETEYGNRTPSFADYGEALRLAKWMQQMNATSIGKLKLSASAKLGYSLAGPSYPSLTVVKSSELLPPTARGSKFECDPPRLIQ